jgi:serralysin
MPSPFTSSATSTFIPSGVSTIDPLLNEDLLKWQGSSGAETSLTFSFPWFGGASAVWQSPKYSDYSEQKADEHFGLNVTQISAAKNAFAAWADVAALLFTQVDESISNVGDFRVAFSSAVGSTIWGWCRYPNSTMANAADVWINPSQDERDWAIGSYNYLSLIHEIGHGLGLKHPGNYSSSGTGTPGPYLLASLDFRNYTLMSYHDLNASFFDATQHKYINVYPETPMVYDIAAIQYLYGANNSYRTGDDTYRFDPSHPFYITIWDAGGNDTIDLTNFSTDCSIDLIPGHYSSVHYINQGTGSNLYDGSNNLGIAFGTLIENAVGGSGNDCIYGNAAGDRLQGDGGNDTLIGGDGIDIAVFRGNLADYVITYTKSLHQYIVTDKVAGRDGADIISFVESFHFADVTKSAIDFITGVQTPTVLMFSPGEGETGVPVGSDIVLTFNEAIQQSSGIIAIHSGSLTGPVIASTADVLTASILISGMKLTINPTSDLANGTHFFITFADGSIKDLAGNSYSGSMFYDFTTIQYQDLAPLGTEGGSSGVGVVLAGLGGLGLLAWAVL